MAMRHRFLKACSAPYAKSEDDEPLLSQLGMQSMRKMKKRVVEQSYRLLDYHACPDYLKDNEFILSYYRADFPLGQALSSLFRWHNETLNVWTHLLGFLLFLVLTLFAIYELGHLPTFSRCAQGLGLNMSEHCVLETMKRDVAKMMGPAMDRASRWPFFVFMGGSMFCLLASTVCHLFTCHSQSLAVFLMRVDYAGIATMIATSFFPPVYYVFQCEPIWQWIYLSTISTMGIITLGVLFAPALQHGKYRTFRALLFMSMGISGFIPSIHGLMMHWKEPLLPITVALEIGMAGSYCIGTVIYVVRVPERWKPGHFDLGGHSHNIFHMLVIGGAFFHYRAALLFLEWRDSRGCS
ncbi:hypothetical protein L7F22_013346 [Adiantum nelumboides]|nr:hypothetical protein [Adiantum nelumboides]